MLQALQEDTGTCEWFVCALLALLELPGEDVLNSVHNGTLIQKWMSRKPETSDLMLSIYRSQLGKQGVCLNVLIDKLLQLLVLTQIVPGVAADYAIIFCSKN